MLTVADSTDTIPCKFRRILTLILALSTLVGLKGPIYRENRGRLTKRRITLWFVHCNLQPITYSECINLLRGTQRKILHIPIKNINVKRACPVESQHLGAGHRIALWKYNTGVGRLRRSSSFFRLGGRSFPRKTYREWKRILNLQKSHFKKKYLSHFEWLLL